MLERQILNISQDCLDMRTLDQIIHKIKQLAMELERSNPSEWNSFLEAALEQ
jgi:hypothetical protein